MFSKVMNAEMAEPSNGHRGISRGTKGGLWHRAVCVTIDIGPTPTCSLTIYIARTQPSCRLRTS